MHWILGILVANVSITALEWIYRTGQFLNFRQAFWWVLPLMILGQFGLFWGFRGGGASSLIYAGIVFTMINIIFRIANTYLFIGETVSKFTWVALVLVVIATIVGALK